MVGGSTAFADFSANFSQTASFCVWAINTHLGRLWEVAVDAGAITLTLELEQALSYSCVHVLYLVSLRGKILSAFGALGGGFCIHLSLDT